MCLANVSSVFQPKNNLQLEGTCIHWDRWLAKYVYSIFNALALFPRHNLYKKVCHTFVGIMEFNDFIRFCI